MQLLNISKNKTNEIIKRAYEEKGPFRVIKVGSDYRIPKNPLMNGLKTDHLYRICVIAHTLHLYYNICMH